MSDLNICRKEFFNLNRSLTNAILYLGLEL